MLKFFCIENTIENGVNMKHTKSYLKGHPNPQFSRKSFVNLDGEWDFIFDDSNSGIKNKYYINFPKSRKIIVPFSYECHDSKIGEEEVHNICWYHKTFEYKKDNKRLLLNFEGVDYQTRVYINGEFVGSHVGAYSRFSFDITDYVNDGNNEIVVKVYDDLSALHSRGKQRWMDHNYECFYVQTTGIWKTVWLEKVGSSYFKNIIANPSYKNTNVEFEYLIEGNLENLEIETEISFDNYIIYSGKEKVLRNVFKNIYDLTSDKATMKLHNWSPDNPNLYDVVFKIYKNGIVIDEVMSYFGVAEYLSRGNTILLNRNPIFPKLILDQGYLKNRGLTYMEEDIIKDISLMKDIGLNGCRKHQKIEADLFYYYCDIMGYYLWQELPSFYEWKNSVIKTVSNEWLEILTQHHNHPSVMTNVVINESWGTMSILNDEQQQEFVKGLYHLTKSIDPHRFVVSNDGWEQVDSDLITLHNYSAHKDELLLDYSNFDKEYINLKRTIFTGPKVLLDDGVTKATKPVLLTEFAGIAFSKDKNLGWGYNGLVKDEEEFLNRFKGAIDAIIESRVFCGYCITQLSDVQQEVNGLVDENRNYKIDKNKLKEIIDRRY